MANASILFIKSTQGIGLFLCKNLVELMGGEISLDDDYDSGIPNQPGTRFVVNLKVQPVDVSVAELVSPSVDETASGEFDDVENALEEDVSHDGTENKDSQGTEETSPSSDVETTSATSPIPRNRSFPKNLPPNLSVLLVDDDSMIRKMFSRAIVTVAPTWTFRQAANGETALRITEDEQFDLIFMDMYMASVEKQLLGTETVAEMRSRGIKSRICGLSANDKEIEFLEVGADAFAFKPFPCAPAALTAELLRVLHS